MRNFKNYQVWELGHKITLDVYKITKKFPTNEKYGLISQMRRASSSVPANIAEGCGRVSDAEFRRFLNYSKWICNRTRIFFDSSR